jgi:hypothetical protein
MPRTIHKPEPKAENPVVGPGRLDRGDNRRLIWHHVLKPGVDWRVALEPSYWWACAPQLGQGHRIEIANSDYTVMIEAIVTQVNPHGFPNPRVDLHFVPVIPRDLELPAAQISAPSRYLARQLSINGNWEVVDTTTDQLIQADMSKHAALSLVGTLESQIAVALEAQNNTKAA